MRLRSQAYCIGTWLSIGSPVVAELASECGFDWLLFDLEHGCATEASLFSSLQAIKGTTAAAIVRISHQRPDLILHALDAGADGIMLPHISSVDELEEGMRAIHYPPRGSRGVSRTVRTYGYGLHAPANLAAIEPPVVLAQIETLQGVKHAQQIGAVKGLDGLFVGPADLKFDLSIQPAPSDTSYDQCLKKVTLAARHCNVQCGILAREMTSQLAQLKSAGFNHIAIESDIGLLRQSYLTILQNK